MRRLTTDMPENNTETALNLFYVKDGWTWVTGGGPAPKYEDVSLCDYVRMIVNKHNLAIDLGNDDYDLSDAIAEQVFDGTDTIEGIVATLYMTGWASAELRERLKAYEDTGLEPKKVKALLDPPNPPLTLEELQEMDGEPVWVISPDNRFEPYWMLVMVRHEFVMANWEVCDFNAYGKTWLAYRRKPEEGKTWQQ